MYYLPFWSLGWLRKTRECRLQPTPRIGIAGAARLERATSHLAGERSFQLSYAPTFSRPSSDHRTGRSIGRYGFGHGSLACIRLRSFAFASRQTQTPVLVPRKRSVSQHSFDE